eukprot:3264744-Pleurochrysis_carterae.AAC.1
MRNAGDRRPTPSHRVLLLFSGPFARPDGISSLLARYGVPTDSTDNDCKTGGGKEHDILNNA